MRPQTAAPGDAALTGMALGVLAYAFFAVQDSSIKWLVATLPVWQVMFCRSVTVVIACLVIGRGRLLHRAVETPIKGQLILRGATTFAAWLCYYTAARSLPLAQLICLYFAAPLIVTLLAAPMLGEHVTRARWATVALGFAGVVVATDPFGLRPSFATGLVLTAAVIWAFAMILMRRIARRESSLLQMLYTNLCFLVGAGAVSAFIWRAPTEANWVLLVLVGAAGGLGQFALFESARRAPAAVMATVEYSALLWAFILGYAIWGDIPRPAVFIGAALIVSAGAALVIQERLRARRGLAVAGGAPTSS